MSTPPRDTVAEREAAFDARVHTWLQNGLYSRDHVRDGLTAEVRSKNGLGAIDHFDAHFRFHQDASGHWSEHTFSTFLASHVPPALRPLIHEASPILFRSVARNAQAPFGSPARPPPARLTHDELLRGVALHVPAYNSLSRGQVRDGRWRISRQWTPLDYARHFFLSCATALGPARPHVAGPAEHRDEDPTPRPDPEEDLHADVSAESPGLRDTLDALSVTQPGGRAERVPRAALEPVARSLGYEDAAVGWLRVRRRDWTAVVKLALALRGRAEADEPQHHATAERLVRTLVEEGQPEWVAYRAWKERMLAPHIRGLSFLFLSEPC